MEHFLKRCFYQSGQYNSEENFRELDIKLKEKEVIRFPKSINPYFSLSRTMHKELNRLVFELISFRLEN